MNKASDIDALNLAGVWSLSDADGGHAVKMTVPGDGITALFDAGELPDPYWGENELQCRWVAERDWVLSRKVTLDDTDVSLVIAGLDTVATVRWNGQEVLKGNNAFRTYRASLSDVARTGENDLEITFHSSVTEGEARQKAQPFYVPFSKNCPIPNGNMLRKPACDFGWDWNIALAPFGITDSIRLERTLTHRVSGILIDQNHTEGAVAVTVTAQIEGPDLGAELTFTLDDQTINASATNGQATATFTIHNPDLWWPAGQGDQPLLPLVVTCGDQVETRRIGLRNIKLVSEPDDIGRSFKIRVNGRDVFCKGANWIPSDALPGRITREATRDLLQSAVDANMNMIRIWGGGRYEPNWFYDLCDEMGLMVWQDAMFACNLYPADRAFLEEVDAEVRENALRLNHHASLALWCGDNELIGALTWYPESIESRDRYLVAYDRLNRTIETALLETLPNTNWWPSSPSPGPMSFGDAWHDDTSGDMHFWSVWHEGRDFDHYRDVVPRFCSEFGFQSYPSMDVIKTFADDADWNIAAPTLEAHQKNAGGNARIAETMFRYFRFPEGFENFVYLSQVQQGLAIETAVNHWRAMKPRSMGALYWQLNDTWPVASWASLDYGGGWKLLHHMARRFFQSVTVNVVPTDSRFRFMGVNDGAAETKLRLTVEALRPNGETRPLLEAKAMIPTDRAVEIAGTDMVELKADEILIFSWISDAGAGSAHFAPKPYKSYQLLPSELHLQAEKQGDHYRLTLSAKHLALFASVEASQPGRFSDNAVLVRPGCPVELDFTPQGSAGEVAFTTRDLHSATHKTQVPA